MKKFTIVGLVALVFVCANLVNFKYGQLYRCMNGAETFSSRLSSYGFPLPYLQRSLHGYCIGQSDQQILVAGSNLDFGHRFISKNLYADIASGVVLIAGTHYIFAYISKKKRLVQD